MAEPPTLTTHPHPLTDRFMQMRYDRLCRRLSFLAGIMFGIAIFCLWMALAGFASLPAALPELTVIISQPEGIDI